MESQGSNNYGIFMVYSSSSLTSDELEGHLLEKKVSDSDLLFVKRCCDREGTDVNRYMCCLRKSFCKHLRENCDFKRGNDFNIETYRVKTEPLKGGTTYALYFNCSGEEKNLIISLLQKFESQGFLNEGSWKVHTPKNYPSGDERKYFIVSFQKNGDRYPKIYIKKLRALLNNMKIGQNRIRVSWASFSVLKDTRDEQVKEKKF